MIRTMMKHARPALVLILSGLLWVGCKSREQELAEMLPELPQGDTAKLRAVPNTNLVATRQLQRAPVETQGPPAPPCTADASITDFVAEVNYPVTVCSPVVFDVEHLTLSQEKSGPATHKLEISKLPPDAQSASGSKAQAASQFPFAFCRTDNGPWLGQLTNERLCTFTCRPINTLTLVNTPNTVLFGWYGSIDDHPPDFSYASPPVSLGTTDEGSCHGPDVATPRK